MLNEVVKRGEIWLCDFGSEGLKGSEQKGYRPCLVLSNDLNNRFSPVITVIAITGQISKARLPVHVVLEATKYNLPKDSVLLGEQLRTISKERLKTKIAKIDSDKMDEIQEAVMIQLGFIDIPTKKSNDKELLAV